MEAKIFNHTAWISETEPMALQHVFGNMLRDSGHKILRFSEYYFEPEGYTALYLLGESHFAIHTFPEQNTTYIELSSCNEEFFRRFLDLLNQITW